MPEQIPQESGAAPENTLEVGTPELTQQVLESLTSEDSKESDKTDAKAAESSTVKEGSAKALPWDKDPRWKSARTAEKNLTSMLKAHGYEDMEELEADLSSGSELKDLLGGRDAKSLIKASETLERYEEHWATQKLKELEEDEEPEDTIERLKKDVTAAKKETQKLHQEQSLIAENKQAIKKFDSTVIKAIKDAEFSEVEQQLASLVLGVNNPANTIDINNKVAIKKMANGGIKQLKTFFSQISQDAVNKYATGKSKITPITKSGSESTPAVTKKQLSKDASIEDTFESARAEMLELIQKATA